MATPVAGLASAATSFSVRFGQPSGPMSTGLRCHDGLAVSGEQPDPVPPVAAGSVLPQAVSVQCREPEDARRSVVPPTDVTYCRAAGYTVP